MQEGSSKRTPINNNLCFMIKKHTALAHVTVCASAVLHYSVSAAVPVSSGISTCLAEINPKASVVNS